jgi:hypothetical protein
LFVLSIQYILVFGLQRVTGGVKEDAPFIGRCNGTEITMIDMSFATQTLQDGWATIEGGEFAPGEVAHPAGSGEGT